MSAAVLQFPANVQRQAKRRMNRVEIEARHRWMRQHSKNWATEQTDGSEPAANLNPRQRELMKLLDKEWGTVKGPTMKQMRREMTENRKLIEKRNAATRWLASLGVDLAGIKGPEQALFAVFDKLADAS